jgi:hypothetical protein
MSEEFLRRLQADAGNANQFPRRSRWKVMAKR